MHATPNFGGSSPLAGQTEKGASTDVFVSADEAKMDQLQKNGLILVATDNADFEIRYPVAILRETKRRAAVERFPRYFGSSDALDSFARCGFVVQR